MGQKTHPYGFRLVLQQDLAFALVRRGNYAELLHQDLELRSRSKKRLSHAGVSEIDIERAADRCG